MCQGMSNRGLDTKITRISDEVWVWWNSYILVWFWRSIAKPMYTFCNSLISWDWVNLRDIWWVNKFPRTPLNIKRNPDSCQTITPGWNGTKHKCALFPTSWIVCLGCLILFLVQSYKFFWIFSLISLNAGINSINYIIVWQILQRCHLTPNLP